MLKFIIPTILFIVFSIDCFSQKEDSLLKVARNGSSAELRIKAYSELAGLFAVKSFDRGLDYARTGLSLAVSAKHDGYVPELNRVIGVAHYFKGNYDSAAHYYYKALGLVTENDLKVKALILNDIGKLYRKTKDLNRSLQQYEEALSIYKKLNDIDGQALILNESGVVYEYKKDYDEAIRRYRASLAIREKQNDLLGKSYSLNFIGGAYTLKGNFSEAKKSLEQSLAIRQQLKDSFAIALSYSDLGSMYEEQGEYLKAAENIRSSNSIAEQIKYPELISANYRNLSNLLRKTGNHAAALDYYQKHISLKDSIFAGEKLRQIEELNTRYETEKKDQRLKLQAAGLQKRNLILLGVITFALLMFATGFNFYKKRQAENKLQLATVIMEKEKAATRAVIEAEENERKRIAAELHDGIGQMMSAAKMNLSVVETEIDFKDPNQQRSFTNAIRLVDESCREVRMVSHQMMPNALMTKGLGPALQEFIDKIDSRIIDITLYTEGFETATDKNIETVLYRVIQECVNNTIKHAAAENLDISVIKDSGGISATIEDNGKGFEPGMNIEEGIGMKNMRSRIDFLKGSLEVDSQPGKGTLIAIHVPVS